MLIIELTRNYDEYEIHIELKVIAYTLSAPGSDILILSEDKDKIFISDIQITSKNKVHDLEKSLTKEKEQENLRREELERITNAISLNTATNNRLHAEYLEQVNLTRSQLTIVTIVIVVTIVVCQLFC